MSNAKLRHEPIYADGHGTKRQIARVIPRCRSFKTRNLIKRRVASNAVTVKPLCVQRLRGVVQTGT